MARMAFMRKKIYVSTTYTKLTIDCKTAWFELINESSSKLDKTPSPSYFMFIPSKLYFMDTKGNVTFSNLILSPFSYEVIEEQIVGNQTNDSIVTSYLPSNFYAKKGYRDMIYNDPHKITDNMSIMIGTMPFIVIISSIDYEYNGDELNTIVLSTPLENQKITKQDMKNIKDYVRDNSDRLEVKINGSESVYQTVQENVEKQLSFMFTDEKVDDQSVMNILGGKEDGGNYGTILKKVNGMITPKDPMESSE